MSKGRLIIGRRTVDGEVFVALSVAGQQVLIPPARALKIASTIKDIASDAESLQEALDTTSSRIRGSSFDAFGNGLLKGRPGYQSAGEA